MNALIALVVAVGTAYAVTPLYYIAVPDVTTTTPEQDQAQQDRLDRSADQKAEHEKKARHDAADQVKQDKADQAQQADLAKKAQADRDAAAKTEPANRPQPDQPAQQR